MPAPPSVGDAATLLMQQLRNEAPLALAESLKHYDTTSTEWREAKSSIEEFAQLLQRVTTEKGGIEFLKSIGAINAIRQLIPMNAQEQISKLPLPLFCLGLIYATPYQAFTTLNASAEKSTEISMQARKRVNDNGMSCIYGEVLFFSFAYILDMALKHIPMNGSTFVDLGSGAGQVVYSAALLHNFATVRGVELLKELHDEAEQRRVQYKNIALNPSPIDFVQDDILNVDWHDANVVFCHSTCFDNILWQKISKKAEKLRGGSIFISSSHILASNLFEIVEKINCTMAWGVCTVYIHKRQAIGRWASRILGGNRKALDHTTNKLG